MKKLYVDCSMGAAGDMLAAALLELFPNPEEMVEELNHIGLEGVRYVRETSVKCGITGTYFKVLVQGKEEHEAMHKEGYHHDHHEEAGHHHNYYEKAVDQESLGTKHHEHHSHDHHGRGLHEISHIVMEHLHIKEEVKKDIMAVYRAIAKAESKVHGVPVTQIHFHEVGDLDAIADITAVCFLIHRLGVEEINASPIHVGSGQVRCAHGILPVPAPATAILLQGIPCYGGEIKGELCTPTGAALLRYFVKHFGPMPVMEIERIGYGMGKKDFSAANCIRIFAGEEKEKKNRICELACNIDDMTGEAVGFAIDRILEAGAVDVYTIPIYMKKSRPAVLFCVMCHEEDKERILHEIFKYTTTIGIRENRVQRYILDRRIDKTETPYGNIRCKISEGYGVERKKYEYEDLSKIAKENHLSIQELTEILSKGESIYFTEGKRG